MTKFESRKVQVQADSREVFDFLSDFRNFNHLMPEQVTHWQAAADRCSFTIEGVASLSMRIASTSPHSNIHIVAEGKNPVDYTMDCFIYSSSPGESSVSLELDAALNPFMKMMASRPLQNFVDMLAGKLQEHFARG